ncbi:MAG: ribonuclease P protein subunit [Candidatus Woesearchaeota archaeon]|nr:MAG: ribonuclease P protein subunit [Candidatus Woesearchaeota archaeon]
MRTPRNIVRHELIGLPVKLVKANNPNNLKIKGNIVDETKKTLIIDQEGVLKRVFKDQVTLQLDLLKQKVEINGKIIVGRPWERLNKKLN